MTKQNSMLLLCVLHLLSCNLVPHNTERDELQSVPLQQNSFQTVVFNNKVLQDTVFAYVDSYKHSFLDDSIPQLFCIYVYLDRQKDTIIDVSNSIAFRVDLDELFGIYTKGETTISGKRLIIRYRSIDSFSAINEAVLQESSADSVNIFTKNPELMSRISPNALRPTSRVYKLCSRDSLQLLSQQSLVPTYDNPDYAILSATF